VYKVLLPRQKHHQAGLANVTFASVYILSTGLAVTKATVRLLPR
jgi:hypothetical protein